MAFRRTAVPEFELANGAYANAVVSFFQVDTTTLERTTQLATIYDAPAGGNQLENPYTLNGQGRAGDAIYIEEPVIAVIGQAAVADHETGIIYPQSGSYRGDWATGTVYLPGEIVRDGSAGANTANLYIASSTHTSGTWLDDLGANLWTIVVDVAAIAAAAEAAAAAEIAGIITDNDYNITLNADLTVSSFGASLVDDADAATARDTLDLTNNETIGGGSDNLILGGINHEIEGGSNNIILGGEGHLIESGNSDSAINGGEGNEITGAGTGNIISGSDTSEISYGTNCAVIGSISADINGDSVTGGCQNCVVIGSNSGSIGANCSVSTLIGDGFINNSCTDTFMIGDGFINTGGTECIVIGTGVMSSNNSNSTIIGYGVMGSGIDTCLAIGDSNAIDDNTTDCMIIGDSNAIAASNTNSIVLGYSNSTDDSVTGGMALGVACQSNNDYAMATGYASVNQWYGSRVHAAGTFTGTDGDAMAFEAIYRGIVTSSSFQELFLDGSAEYFVLPENSAIAFTYEVVMMRTDMVGDVNIYTGGGGAANIGGTLEIKGNAGSGIQDGQALIEEQDASGAGISIDTAGTTATTRRLRIGVFGVNSQTWRCVATIRGVIVKTT